MNNATAVSRRHPFEDLAFAGAVVVATASSVTAEPKLSPSRETGRLEFNPTRSDATVGLEGVQAEFKIERVTASVPFATEVAKPSQAPVPEWKTDAYMAIDALAALSSDWDSAENVAASDTAVRLARSIIREWPSALPNPEVDLLSDGNIVLEVFDENGMAMASVEARADGSTAYVVAKGTDIILSQKESDSSPVRIGAVLGTIRDEID